MKISKSFLRSLSKAEVIAVDTETTGLKKEDNAFCISFTMAGVKKDIYFSGAVLNKEISENKIILKKILENPNSQKVFHNARFDIYYLRKLGFKIPFETVDDTMIIAHLLFSDESKKLKEIGKKHISSDAADLADELEAEFERLGMKDYDQRQYNKINQDLLRNYAMQDTILTLKVYNFFIDLVQKAPESRKDQIRKLYKLELKTMKILYEIENSDLLLNKLLIEKMKKEFKAKENFEDRKIKTIAKKYGMPDMDSNSHKQLITLLEKTGFDLNLLSNTKTGKSLQKKDIKILVDQDKTGLLKSISEYGHYHTMVSTYLDNFLKGRKVNPRTLAIGPKFSQTVAVTGRFSSFDPNFQNLPRGPEIRQCIIAPPGYYIVKFDYSQIEVRVLAHCSKDFRLSSIFLEDKDPYNQAGTIIYQVQEEEIAKDKLGKRFICKKVVLGIMYSMGPKTMSKVINGELAGMEDATVKSITLFEAKDFIDKWFSYYKKANQYKWKVYNFAKKYGYVLNIYGRKRNLQYDKSYRALNTIIQGSTADILRFKMCQVDQELQTHKIIKDAKLILQVHDELAYYIPKDKLDKTVKLIKEVMSDQDIGVCKFSVPLKVDVEYGNDYGHLKEYIK